MSPDWALMRAILAELAGGDGLTDAELAERLAAAVADVRQAARILYHQRKLDRCWQYNVRAGKAHGQRTAA